MARDVTGVSRPNMFEILTDSNGTTYTPQSGQNGKVTYRSSNGVEIKVPNYRMSGDELRMSGDELRLPRAIGMYR